MSADYDPRFLEYIQLFNTRKYWHAHEALEKLWLAQKDHPDRTFYKGLIQMAAALYHVEKGNFRGAGSLFESASRYLCGYPPGHLGIGVPELIQCVKDFIAGREKEGSSSKVKRPMIKISSGI